MLKASTVMRMASPGKTGSQGATTIQFTPSRIMLPQVGTGGGTPNPMKERFASMRMAVAVHKVPITRISPKTLGNNMPQEDPPRASTQGTNRAYEIPLPHRNSGAIGHAGKSRRKHNSDSQNQLFKP